MTTPHPRSPLAQIEYAAHGIRHTRRILTMAQTCAVPLGLLVGFATWEIGAGLSAGLAWGAVTGIINAWFLHQRGVFCRGEALVHAGGAAGMGLTSVLVLLTPPRSPLPLWLLLAVAITYSAGALFYLHRDIARLRKTIVGLESLNHPSRRER